MAATGRDDGIKAIPPQAVALSCLLGGEVVQWRLRKIAVDGSGDVGRGVQKSIPRLRWGAGGALADGSPPERDSKREN